MKNLMIGMLALALSGIGTVSDVAAAPVLCRKGKKAVFVRDDACRKRERQVSLTDFPDGGTLGAIRRIGLVRLGDGQTQTLLEAGPLSLTARCRIDDAGDDVAEILIATTQNGAAFDGDESSTNLTTATPAEDRQFAAVSTGTGNPAFDAETDGSAVAPDGTQFSGLLFVGVNVLNAPQQCVFGGHVIVSAGQS